ncbi:hypothetical protein ACFPRL_27315 [Pseudoclavibacter helvolus]|uniref:hypothetical protein n=1 Tax=Pseudoclavibacter helvolus TaxID=255205 RepID=UPI0035E6AEFC
MNDDAQDEAEADEWQTRTYALDPVEDLEDFATFAGGMSIPISGDALARFRADAEAITTEGPHADDR